MSLRLHASIALLLLASCAPTTAAAPAAEAPRPRTAFVAGGPRTADDSCPVVGRWRGTVPGGILSGLAMDLEFFEGGTATGRVSWVTLSTTWRREGDLVEITDVSAVPALATCPSHVVGRYRLRFEGRCGAVHVVGADDSCTHRRLSLDGLVAERQP